MDDIFWPLLLASMGAMAKVFIICFVGAIAGLFPRSDPILSKQTLKGLSRVITYIVMPASMISGWGLSLSVEVLSHLWVILPWSAFNTVLSFLVAWPAFRFLNLSGDLPVVLTAGCAFHNAVILPWLLLDSLCTQGAFPTIVHCREQVTGCCFVYLVPFHLLFWTIGPAILMEEKPKTIDPKPSDQPPVEDVKAEPPVPDLEVSGAVLDIEAPFLHEDAKHLTTDLHSPNSLLTSLVRTDSSLCTTLELLNAKPKLLKDQVEEHHDIQQSQSKGNTTKVLKRVFLNPAMVAIPLALFCALLDPVRRCIFEASTPLSPFGAASRTLTDTMLGISTLILAGSLVTQDNWLSGSHIPRKFILVPLFTVIRLIIIPAVGIGVFLTLKRWAPFLVGDPLTQVTIVMQFACPSSMSAVMLLQAYGRQEAASVLAYLYVFQHLAAGVILTLVTSLGMYFAVTW